MSKITTIKTASIFFTGLVKSSCDQSGFIVLYIWRTDRQSAYPLNKVTRFRHGKVRLQGCHICPLLEEHQALALELYWNRFQESEFLWLGGWDALIGWLQMLVMLGGILLIWLLYVSLVLRFSWLP